MSHQHTKVVFTEITTVCDLISITPICSDLLEFAWICSDLLGFAWICPDLF